jgi:two-component system heavy metal sensor histidine kinase CusS
LFRVKIVLLSVLLSGLVLVGLCLYSLSAMNKVGMARIDREILTLGEGHLAIRPPRDYWQNFETSLRFIYGDGWSENLVVQVRDPRQEVLFKSSHWPTEITEDSFPDFDRAMDVNPPKPEARDRRGPPPEAYKACEGKGAGSTSQFVNARGEMTEGTCEKENGRLVLRPFNPPPPSNQPEPPVPRIKKTPRFATIQTPSGAWRTAIMGSDRITIMVGANLADYYKDASRYRMAFLGIVPIALLLLAGGGWVIAQRALKPIALITRTAEGITVRALDQRIPPTNGDRELSRLVEVINGMLDRLEKSFGQAVRFSADAAHELQTPLAILQGELDDAVQHASAGSEEQQRYSGLLEEVQRLKAIVQKLLILARVDAGRLELHLEPMDLSAMIESAVEDAGVMAPHLQLDAQIAPGVIVKADPDLMGQVVWNLTSNAVKYNHENGFIRFELSVRDNRAYVTISNAGVSIPVEDREKIFDRFYRVDQSRTKAVPGSGLGLSLAREIARAHGGNLLLNADSASVTSFVLSLPCSPST